ncbi:hypothetical protein FHG87_024010, partial [Trinorchestia longiramus]
VAPAAGGAGGGGGGHGQTPTRKHREDFWSLRPADRCTQEVTAARQEQTGCLQRLSVWEVQTRI